MNYFKNKDNEIFAYDYEQIGQGYGKELTPISSEEKDKLLEPTIDDLNNIKIAEAKHYLASTDYYMTVDKYDTLSDDKKESLIKLRSEARVLINKLSS